MAQLIIRGHETRGKEVIEILKMIGGKISVVLCGYLTFHGYYIKSDGFIGYKHRSDFNNDIVYSLEEFLEKFPYKVGDKVNSPCKGCVKTITSMEWDTYLNTVTYKLDNRIYTNIDQLKVVNDLQPYEEETMEKIDVAKLLKNCPQGMELDCILFDAKVIYQGLSKRIPTHPIVVQTEHGFEFELTQYGQIHNIVGSNCVIYPKGKTTWEGFHRPFKDGDILFYKHKSNNVKYVFIYKRRIDMHYLLQYCGWFSEKPYLSEQFNMKERIPLYENDDIRFATEEEKEKLFKAIKDNGYKWNADTKTLEKVDEPKFHEGDWIIRNNKDTGIPVKVIGFNDYYSCELNGEVVNLTRNDVHNNFHLWTIDDAKNGDVLAINWHEGDDSWEKIIIFKKYHNNGIEGLINSPCVEGYGNTFKNGKLVFHEEVPYFSKTWTANLHPATKEQCKLLFQKIKEVGYVWNAETKTFGRVDWI